MKHLTTYQQSKPEYDGLRAVKDKDAYRREHESAVILHEAAAKAIRAITPPNSKPLSLATIRSEHVRLSEKKDVLAAEYAALKRQAREYGIIKNNVDSILNPGEQRTRGRERGAEL
jgi:hypothetical protein